MPDDEEVTAPDLQAEQDAPVAKPVPRAQRSRGFPWAQDGQYAVAAVGIVAAFMPARPSRR
jgi:hypothetical protein